MESAEQKTASDFFNEQVSQATSNATALHHTLERWQHATSGMMIARCMYCSALVYVMPSGVISGGAVTLQCTSDFPSAYGANILSQLQRSIPDAPKRVRPVFHPTSDLTPNNAPCPHCGNRSTIQTRGCKHCGANADLAVKTKPKKRNIPSTPQDYIVAHNLTLDHGAQRVRYKSMQTAIGRYTAPCGAQCNARALYMPEDYYGIGVPERIIAIYNCDHNATDCYRILAPEDAT